MAKTKTRPAAKRKASRTAATNKRWSAAVSERSDALDLEPGVFTWRSAARIAASLKHSAEVSKRRKADPYRSAQSMLTFYINRAGKGLSAERKKVLQRAKGELRRLFSRE
jgi:hypothetical protein